MRRGSHRYGRGRSLVHALLAGLVLATAAPASAADKLVLAYGDSLTAGYGLLPNQGFVPRLQAALRHSGVHATVANAGVSGDTTAAGRARLAWVLKGLKTRPDLVIVELGANDMLRGIDPVETRSNLDALLGALEAEHLSVLLAGMKAAPNMGRLFAMRFEAIYPALAAKYHVPLYPFFLDGAAAKPKLLQADGMHPNPRGVAVIVRAMLPAVKDALKPPKARAASAH